MEFKEWIYTKGSGKNTFVVSVKDEPLESNICVVNSSRFDAEQNAKLIAAAPRLLQELYNLKEQFKKVDKLYTLDLRAIESAEEAIKKATK